MSIFKRLLLVLSLLVLAAVPVTCTYVCNLTQAEKDEWKMWINLFKNGWAEPMRDIDNETGQEKIEWYEWHKQIEQKMP